MDISDWRIKIDSLDTELVRLLNERAGYAIEIGHIKQQKGLPIFDSEREAKILARISNSGKGPLSAMSLERIFKTIIEECRQSESDQSRETWA